MCAGFPSIWVEVKVKGNRRNLVIGGFYREWGSTAEGRSITAQAERLDILLQQMEKATERNKTVVSLGDMNIDQNRWESASYHLRRLASKLKSTLSSNNMENLPLGNTYKSFGETSTGGSFESALDHVYFSRGALISGTTSQNATSDHTPIIAELRTTTERRNTAGYKFARNLKRISKEVLNRDLLTHRWELLCGHDDVDAMVDQFTAAIRATLDRLAPVRKIKVRGTRPLSLSKQSRNLMRQRDKARRDDHIGSYRRLRNLCTSRVRKERLATTLNHLSSATSPTDIWQIVSDTLNPKSAVGPRPIQGCTGAQDSAEALNGFFRDKVIRLRGRLGREGLVESSPPTSPKSAKSRTGGGKPSLTFHTVSTNEVLKAISKLKNSKAAGTDGIPVSVLKDGAAVLALPLTWIINSSISSGKFPTAWKSAIVTPILKKGDPSNTANYRPVSNLCSASKVLEEIIRKQLYGYFERNNFLPKSQHGFRANRSTSTALASLHSQLISAKSEGKSFGLACFDLSAAFDTIDHNLLLTKLAGYGLDRSSLVWVKSFLSNRTQSTRWGQSLSSPHDLPACGFPQGSAISPLLFLIMISDLDRMLERTRSVCYADDINILATGNTSKEVITDLGQTETFCNGEEMRAWYSVSEAS